MTPQTQEVTDNNKRGDCFRACVASLLDCDITRIPHFFLNPDETYDGVNEWLSRTLNLGLLCWKLDTKGPREALVQVCEMQPNWELFYILTGSDGGGRNHSVVAQGFELVWDPHPDKPGVDYPATPGFYQATFLVYNSWTSRQQVKRLDALQPSLPLENKE